LSKRSHTNATTYDKPIAVIIPPDHKSIISIMAGIAIREGKKDATSPARIASVQDIPRALALGRPPLSLRPRERIVSFNGRMTIMTPIIIEPMEIKARVMPS